MHAFFSPRLSQVVILSVDDQVCIFVLFVVWMRHLAQGATGDWVMLDLVFKWFPLCEFSLFYTPQGQFSGGLGSWSQCSYSEDSGLDLSTLSVSLINSSGGLCNIAFSEVWLFAYICRFSSFPSVDFQFCTIIFRKEGWYYITFLEKMFFCFISSVLSWKMFYVHLRRMCILPLLNGMFYIFVISSVVLKYRSVLTFHY